MSAQSDALAARLRPLAAERHMVEKRIIGGIGFMLNGNFAVGTTSNGDLLCRIDQAHEADALARPGAYVAVSAATLDDAARAGWLAYSLDYVETLPPK
jgi:hypothetical protein